MKFSEGERILILGGSRGLGAAFVSLLKEKKLDVISLSRKSAVSVDFSQTDKWPEILQTIRQFKPSRIIYCAAGGPYGRFGQFEWKDHSWSMKVTFEFPAYLLHSLLNNPLDSLKQFIAIGSSIAESQPDAGAAAYSAAKHALRGLISSVQTETLPFDLRLLSPAYMKTDLLPMDSAPRKQGVALDPFYVAALMIQSISDHALGMKNQSFD